MSIAELTAPRLPRRTGSSLRRQWRELRASVSRAARLYKRRLLRVFLSWHRQQYYFWITHRDIGQAIRRNEDIFLAASLIFALVLFAAAATASQIGLMLSLTMYAVSDQLGLSFIPLLLLSSGLMLLLFIWVIAWMTNLVSMALMDGANRKQLTSLRGTLRRSLASAIRVSASWLLYVTAVMVPALCVAGLAAAVLLAMTTGGEAAIMQTSLIAGSTIAAWLLYAITSYGLVPLVALFEPEVPLTSTLQRSRLLVAERGRPFIFALFTLCGLGLVAAAQLEYWLEAWFGVSAMLVILVAVLVAAFAVQLGLTMLYRKRKHAYGVRASQSGV